RPRGGGRLPRARDEPPRPHHEGPDRGAVDPAGARPRVRTARGDAPARGGQAALSAPGLRGAVPDAGGEVLRARLLRGRPPLLRPGLAAPPAADVPPRPVAPLAGDVRRPRTLRIAEGPVPQAGRPAAGGGDAVKWTTRLAYKLLPPHTWAQ